MLRILMVCTGNTCRSPMAAALLQHRVRQEGLEACIEVSSAGVMAACGEEASPQARAALAQRGLDAGGHRARLLTPQALAQSDLVLVMTPRHKQLLLGAVAGLTGRVYTLSEYAGESGEVSDPYGGDGAAYAVCAAQLDRLLARAWKKILALAGKNEVMAKKDE